MTKDPDIFSMNAYPPTKEESDKLKTKLTLMRSMKKLLRVCMMSVDRATQAKQIGRLYTWFNERENRELSKEAIQAQ